MQPESLKLLRDMRDAVETIVAHTQGRTGEDYNQLRWLRDAVHWNFTVIGEALSQLDRLDPSTSRRITEYRRIIGFRNQLIHGYGVIQNEITWNIIVQKLPTLRRELSDLLNSVSED
jgi:uncharacterized protein with HEPN domain